MCQECLNFREESMVCLNLRKLAVTRALKLVGSAEKGGETEMNGPNAAIAANRRGPYICGITVCQAPLRTKSRDPQDKPFYHCPSYRRGNWGIERWGNILRVIGFECQSQGRKLWALEAVLLPVMLWDLTVEPRATETAGGLQAAEKYDTGFYVLEHVLVLVRRSDWTRSKTDPTPPHTHMNSGAVHPAASYVIAVLWMPWAFLASASEGTEFSQTWLFIHLNGNK